LGMLARSVDFDLSDIHASLAQANLKMLEESEHLEASRGMGTTVAGIAVVTVAGVEQWAVFNIGDSRIYQYRDGKLDQISTDHSEVQEMISAGRLDPADAATYPRRNVVTRSLGALNTETADTWLLPAEPGQLFLLCSDGLTGELPDSDIAVALANGEQPGLIAQQLVDDAVAAGGHDNVTVLVVRTERGEELVEDTIPRLDVAELRGENREGQS
jgi:serine/threonine protein phosphatase PrpC